MRWPRFRLSIRMMMIGVALIALAAFGARYSWERWLYRGYPNPIDASMDVQYGRDGNLIPGNQTIIHAVYPMSLVAGDPIPVGVGYRVRLLRPMPPPGTTYNVWMGVWFEDQETGLPVDGYTFALPLTVGGRESASGTFTWNAAITQPGTYALHHYAYYKAPFGEWRGRGGGMTGGFFVEAAPGGSIDRGSEDRR